MATTAQQGQVDTAHVAGRRKVHYNSHDEVLADAERLAAGGYQQLGNWSLGEMAQHLSAAMNLALDPSKVRAAWPVRFLARTLYLKKAMRKMAPGFKLPPKAAKVLLADGTGDSAGIDALRTSIDRWKREPQRHPHPFFGSLTPEQWDTLMLRHAEMHMSFLLPQ